MKFLLPTACLAAPIYGATIHGRTESTSSVVSKTTCGGITYEYEELAGYGYVVSDAVDKYGDVLGALGSSIHIDQASWKKLNNGSYTGLLWSLPDRGWNGQGTVNYHPRVHKFTIVFTPNPSATVENPSGPNLFFKYQDTILFTAPDGTSLSGIDPDATGHLSYAGFPELPVATFPGDGFGGAGPGGKSVTVDSEGLYVNDDGSFWVSDEFGPYIYLFGHDGKMLTAIRPPEAIVPRRNGTTSFSSDNPPIYSNGGEGHDVDPENPASGRVNDHGFEALSVSDGGKTLWVLLQTAGVQEGGLVWATSRYVRLLKYDVSNRLAPVYVGEWVVPLPLTVKPETEEVISAAQTEIIALEKGQFLVLTQTFGAGRGKNDTFSTHRHVDVFDMSKATQIKGDKFDCSSCGVSDAQTGALAEGITPATFCDFLDYNDNAQLGRFGLHNGGAQDQSLLNEKWESIGLVPVNPAAPNGEFYLFSLSDNDFVTTNGHMNGGKFHYVDATDVDNQALVFKINISS
ncbi:hypothetical protein Hte_002114 [Hypoxylon texense]